MFKTFLDRLVADGLVDKVNRKFLAAVTILLAAKLNDVKAQRLRSLIEAVEQTFRLTSGEAVQYELATLVAMNFDLLLPKNLLLEQYHRILNQT